MADGGSRGIEEPTIDRARYESFGGILSCLSPPFLAWVDRDFMRDLGYPESDLWKETASETDGHLSAPIEVHWAVTNRCAQGCANCYVEAQPEESHELSTEVLKVSLALLRGMGVFHVALGGGEAFARHDLLEIVTYCRSLGLVPNLTTNGLSIGEREIEICRLMGQVNLSCDGLGELYGINGRKGSSTLVDDAIRRLKRAGVQVGINCVVSRGNFSLLAGLVAYAAEAGLNEVEFLKLKPSGRARDGYKEQALTQDMIRAFYPMIMALARPDSLELKIDCSFIPALLYHRPPVDDLEACAVHGCWGGDLLLSVKSNGLFSGCSFINNADHETVCEIGERWASSPHLRRFRQLVATAEEPCRSCAYLKICRCGCRATALYATGRFSSPDPECPFVFDYEHRQEERNRNEVARV